MITMECDYCEHVEHYEDEFSFFQGEIDRKSTRLNSSHSQQARMPSSA